MLKEKLQNNNILLYLVKIFFVLMFGIMLFPSIIKSIVIIAFSLLILLSAYKRGFVINKPFFLVNSSVYLIFLLTLIYTSNFSEASLKLQTTFSLFVFPLLFSLLNKSDTLEILKNIKIYLYIFIIATFLYNTLPFLWYFITHYTLQDTIKHYPLIIIKYIGKYGIHPIYMSMHCSLSILFSIYLFKDLKSTLIKTTLLLINVILVYFLLVYSKKGPIIALIIILFLWSFFQDRKVKKLYYLTIFSVMVLLVCIPKTRNKFLEILKIEEAKTINSNSTNTRYSIYKTTLFLIKKSPLIGYGIGDYNDQLKLQYKKKAPFLLDKEYNSHNQYLSFLLIGGFPLLIVYLYFLYYNIRLSINHQNYLLLGVIFYYSIVMFSENILERENGVIFFAFFTNFFSLKNYIKNDC